MIACLDMLDVKFLDGRHPIAPVLAESTEVDINVLHECMMGRHSWAEARHGCFLLEGDGERGREDPR